MIRKFKVRRARFLARGGGGGRALGIEPCKIIVPIQLRHWPAPPTRPYPLPEK